MSDKRTFALTTIEISVAYVNGLLVVDTSDLAGADAEQQKILIPTLLNYFASKGENFAIGDLQLKRVSTTNNDITEVLLIDGAGNVVIRDVSELLAGVQAVKTGTVFLVSPATESLTGTAENQRQVNEQHTGKLNDLQNQLDTLTNVSAQGTIILDPAPMDVETAAAQVPFRVLFDSTNKNIIEFDDDNNLIALKANSIYQNQVFLQVSSDAAAQGHTLTIQMVNSDTLTVIREVEIPIPADGYSGTWIQQFSILNAPKNIKYLAFADVAGTLHITQAQNTILSAMETIIPTYLNAHIIDVMGENDATQDLANIAAAVASASTGYIIRLWGTFAIANNLNITGFDGLTIDCTGAFFEAQKNGGTFILFELDACKNITILNPRGTYNTTGNPQMEIVGAVNVCENIKLLGANFHFLTENIGFILPFNDADGTGHIIRDCIFTIDGSPASNQYFSIVVNEKSRVQNCELPQNFVSSIEVDSDCIVHNCKALYPTVNGENNIITDNDFIYAIEIDISTNIVQGNTEQYTVKDFKNAYELSVIEALNLPAGAVMRCSDPSAFVFKDTDGEIAFLNMFFAGIWTEGEYIRNAVVNDGGGTYIALNKTQDRPSPQGFGDAFYIYGDTLPPETVITAKSVTVGQQYEAIDGDYMVTGYKVGIKAGNNYEIVIIVDPDGDNEARWINSFTATEDGWHSFGLATRYLKQGTKIQLLKIITQPQTEDVTTDALYNYFLNDGNSQAPGSGQITHAANAPGFLLVSATDNGGNSIYDALAALTVGDKIETQGIEWAIQSVVDNTTYFTFGISPAARLSVAGLYTFSFKQSVEVPLTLHNDVDYFADNDAVKGVYTTGGIASVVLNDNAYSMDLLIQRAVRSEDWEVIAEPPGVAVSSGSGGSSGDILNIQDRVIDLEGLTKIDMQAGEYFVKEDTATAQAFTLSNFIGGKAIRLRVVGGTLADPLFSNVTNRWKAGDAVTDYDGVEAIIWAEYDPYYDVINLMFDA